MKAKLNTRFTRWVVFNCLVLITVFINTVSFICSSYYLSVPINFFNRTFETLFSAGVERSYNNSREDYFFHATNV